MRRRGSILPMVLGILSLLLILLGCLRLYEELNREGLERAETALQSRVALRWWQASWLEGKSPTPPRLRVSATGSENEALKKAAATLEEPWAAAIFDRDKLPDLTATPAEGLRLGQRLARVEMRDGLPQRTVATAKLTASHSFPYAACALRGNVVIHRLRSWANPRWSERDKPEAQGGGVAARVYAGHDAEVNRLDYGEVLVGGQRAPRIKEGQALARTQAAAPTGPDGKPLEDFLQAQIQGAIRRLLERNREDGDKTGLVFNQMDIGMLLEYTTGLGDWERFRNSFMSLATATEFPFFTWCTIRMGVSIKPPRISAMTIRLHGTLPPDMPVLEDLIPTEAPPTPSEEANKAMLAAVRKAFQESPEAIKRRLGEELQSQARAAGPAPSTGPSEGEFRSDEDRLKITWDGQPGVVYLGYLKELGRVIEALGLILQIPPKIAEACRKFPKNVRVYWFGSEKFVSKFQFGHGEQPKLTARATLTVPRGRSFYLKGDLTLEGDLWIQRGASFHVDGSLITVDPNRDGFDYWPFLPHGRIVLEQGATLVVHHNLEVAGSRRWGSVLVTSEDGKVEAITSAILVGRRATFEHGILPGMTIEDLCSAVGRKDAGAARLQREFLEPYFDIYAPNLAKARGPFQVRKPFFADRSTVVEFSPIPIVKPPLRLLLSSNLNNMFFQIATLSEVPFLNAVFGEYMALHSDAWAFGDERVPALVKIPIEPVEAMVRGWGSRYAANRLDSGVEERFTDLLYEATNHAIIERPKKMMTEIYWELFRQAAWVIMPMDPPIADECYKTLATAREKANFLRTHFSYRDLSETCRELQDHLLPLEIPTAECPGVLVYAGDDLSIGKPNVDTSAAVGMFVANGTVSCYSRRLVGSVISFNGSIRCRELCYVPGFTRASIALPGPMPLENKAPLSQIRFTKYGKRLNPRPEALLLGAGKTRLTSELLER